MMTAKDIDQLYEWLDSIAAVALMSRDRITETKHERTICEVQDPSAHAFVESRGFAECCAICGEAPPHHGE
jgi:hypothetical protein